MLPCWTGPTSWCGDNAKHSLSHVFSRKRFRTHGFPVNRMFVNTGMDSSRWAIAIHIVSLTYCVLCSREGYLHLYQWLCFNVHCCNRFCYYAAPLPTSMLIWAMFFALTICANTVTQCVLFMSIVADVCYSATQLLTNMLM